MIIKKLLLHNFRVFRGTHEIDLAPREGTEAGKPIVLLGGLNGAGKTSILTAIRFVLYGKLAFENILYAKDYIQCLNELIHNNAGPLPKVAGALIELTFTYNKDGEESEFTVVRSWQRGSVDLLALYQDGKHLKELNYDQCQGFLNELIPHGIADLFFFDGEKIASLAEDESGSVLQTAVKRLLGLDLIAKLRNDLAIYLKRIDIQGIDALGLKDLKAAENELSKLSLSIEGFRYSADLVKARIDVVSSEIRKQESVFAAQGGAFALTKKQEQRLVDELIKEKMAVEKNIRNELEGSFPYVLAPTVLNGLLHMLEKEFETKQAQSFSKEFDTFMREFKKDAASVVGADFDTVNSLVEAQFKKYLLSLPQSVVFLDISDRETGVIHQSVHYESKNALKRFDEARRRLSEIETALEQAASNIDRAPDEQQLIGVFNTIRSLDSTRADAYTEYKSLLAQAQSALSKKLDLAKKIQKLHDRERSQHADSTAVEHARNTIFMLSDYADELTTARVTKLEIAFASAYSRLASKKDLNITVRINPLTFDVELIDSQGVAINRKSLSAGEKQIYAIAILEALAKTSGRQLPVIIDTPLGRLDSQHRQKLIDNYFTSASHQVVLLSTDTEINEQYFRDKLQPHISHAYQIQFDSTTKSAVIMPGYFWSESEVTNVT